MMKQYWLAPVLGIGMLACGQDDALDLNRPGRALPANSEVCQRTPGGNICCVGGIVPSDCAQEQIQPQDATCSLEEDGALGELYTCLPVEEPIPAPAPTDDPAPAPTVEPTPTLTPVYPPTQDEPDPNPVPTPEGIDGTCVVLGAQKRCCTVGLRPTWWCAESDLRELQASCRVGEGASAEAGQAFSCTAVEPEHPSDPDSSRPNPTLNPVEKSLIEKNAVTRFDGPVDCVRNARSTLHASSLLPGNPFKFETIDDVVTLLMPRGESAKIIGQNLKRGNRWRDLQRKQQARGMRGWHAVNVDTYKRDHGGKMWPNGVAFSGGTRWGHVSVHVSARQPANIELDQYSTRAFQKLNTGASLLRRTQGNGLRTGEVPSTHPDLVNRVQRYMIFQWCHDAWGCPAEQYLLD